jgi:hypothetical protein
MSGAKRLAAVLVFVLVASVLLIVLLIVLARPFLREAIVEALAYAVWLGRLALLAVPQVVWWMLLVVIGSYVAIRTLLRGLGARPRGRDHAPVAGPGPVRTWAKHIEQASQGDYYRERLASGIGRVTVAVLAHTRRAPADEIRRGLAAGQIDLPQDIRAQIGSGAEYLGARLQGRGWRRLLGRFARPRPTDYASTDLERMIRFLESEMEVECGDEAA